MKKLALFGGKVTRKKKFKHSTILGLAERKAVMKLIKNGKLSGFYNNFLGGPNVQEFEKKWSNFFNCKYAVAVNSGTSAQQIALAACGIKKNDEVIVPSLSFTSTMSTVLMNDAVPKFCDIDSKTFNIDVSKIEQLITKKTKAIVPVHLYGVPSQMDTIMKIAKKYNLKVIEDTCQSPGSKFKKKYVGTIGDLGTFSTVETKNISTGEGGVIVGNNKDLIHKCRLIRNHGESYLLGNKRTYQPKMLGYNLRPTEFQAVIGIEQIKKLKKINEIRNHLSDYLIDNLKDIKGITVPKKRIKNLFIVRHLICLQYDEKETGVSKDNYLKALSREGIDLLKGYPFSLYSIYYGFLNKGSNYKKGFCPTTESVINKSIWINQMRPPSTLKDMSDIITAFKKVNSNLSQLKSL